MRTTFTTTWRAALGGMLVALIAAVSVASCSPGSLPGSPSPILTSGGGGRYDGTMSYRRLGGNVAIDESNQRMTMSLTLGASDQFTAQFDSSAGSRGSLQGRLNGALNSGTFQATILVTIPATGVASSIPFGLFAFRPFADTGNTCEGRGEATGSFSGLNLTWTIGTITYSNCTLLTSAQAAATAVSPIPQTQSPGATRANVVITIFPSTTITRGSCPDGKSGFPFTVEIAETAGVAVTLDDTIIVEQRRGGQVVSTDREDNPFTTIAAGEKRRWSACSQDSGTYQAFFSGKDAHGNSMRFSSPLITFGN
jgi:hypothetical protein